MSAAARPLRVAVVGAGVGGLCTAAALARDGADVAVFEQAHELADVGAGLQLAPNATRLLARLGVARHLPPGRAVGAVLRELRRWDDGTVLSRTTLGAACTQLYGAPYLLVLRAHLHAALLDLVGRERVCTARRLTGLTETADEVTLAFADGSRCSADVVVGADGIRSTVRGTLSADRPVFSGHLVYRGLVPAARLGAGSTRPHVTLWLGPDRHCVVYPVAGRSAVSFAATVPAGTGAPPWSQPGSPDDLRAAYAGWHPELQAVLAEAEQVGLWALHDRDPLPTWSTDRSTVVGDAAHPVLPFLAQGANQAVEDAVALAAVLRGAGPADVAAGLRAYAVLRAPRRALIAQASRRNAALLHGSPVVSAGTPEDELLALAWLYGYDVESEIPAPVPVG